MRKLLILQSLSIMAGMPLSYHIYTVRLAEHMISLQKRKKWGAK